MYSVVVIDMVECVERYRYRYRYRYRCRYCMVWYGMVWYGICIYVCVCMYMYMPMNLRESEPVVLLMSKCPVSSV